MVYYFGEKCFVIVRCDIVA